MLYRTAVCFLIFKVLITYCSVANIEEFEAYFLDESSAMKTIKFNRESAKVIPSSSTRVVLNLYRSTYIDEGQISYSDGSWITEVSARCTDVEDDRNCPLNNYPDASYGEFKCNGSCRYIIIVGNLNGLIIQLKGYHTYDEMLLGCFENERAPVEPGLISNCFEHCKNKSSFFFGLQEATSQPKCFCSNVLYTIKHTQLRFCRRRCENAPQRMCGGFDRYFTVYTLKPNRGVNVSFECVFQSARCPRCTPGRKGLNCDVIDCGIQKGGCGVGQCDSEVIIASRRSTVCICSIGQLYRISLPEQFTCIDDDECAAADKPCDETTSRCVNLVPLFRCECKEGFDVSGPNRCSDVDECSLVTHDCRAASSTCRNTIGSYTCECKTGFVRESDRECSDINECSAGVCDSTSTSCVNLPGSYRCNCKIGFEGGSATRCEDIDECERVHGCHVASTICANSPGTYRCDCKIGFVRESDRQCSDIDECIRGMCDTISTICQNIPGTYLCNCKLGFSGGSSSHCEDIDECARDACDRGSTTCRNTPGSFQCNCMHGFRRMTYTACEDIDECLSRTHVCHSISTTCENQPGTYECNCRPGFSGRLYFAEGAMACPDIDECLESENCDVSTTSCQNTPGSFSCNCKIGFSRLTKSNCGDINECLDNPCDLLTTTCSNNLGSFSCECMGGYLRETLFKCEDLDECEQSHPCDVGSTYCKNLPGSFECNCRVGFRRENLLRCKDIDECALLMHNCGKQSLCTNIMGSFTCKCPPGTEGLEYKYSMECKDIDECELPNNCDVTVSVCLNVIMSYICQCYPGYISKDNFSCIKGLATIPTTLHDDDMEYDDFTTEYGYDVATGGDSRGFLDDDYWILFPLFLFFVIGFLCWCYVMSKNEQSRGSSVTSYSFGRVSGISRATVN